MSSRVAVLIHPGRSWGRGLLKGISLFARGHRTWSVYHDERPFTSDLPDWLLSWEGDGMIAAIDSEPLAHFVAERGLPTIDLVGTLRVSGVPCVREDNRAVMQLAVQHLRDLGVERFAYCGFSGFHYSEERERYLRELTSADGAELSVLDSPFDHHIGSPSFEADSLRHESELHDWLRSLTPPTGLIACNDVRALQVLNAAREARIRVPDDLPVVGVDNDEVICDLADPPLSSVELDTVRIGYRAASLLAKLMKGRAHDNPEMLNAPAGIIARQSSDLLAITDPEMAAVARYIVAHACEGLSVDDVVAAAPVARSTLERRFKRAVGRSVKAEINRIRILRIKELLTATNHTLSSIARMTGFEHAEYMSTVFKKHVNTTPGAYRREHSALL